MSISDAKLHFASSIFGISTKPNDEIYYYWFFLKKNLKKIRELTKTQKRYGSEIKYISKEDLQNLSVDLPSIELICKFNSFCAPFFTIQKNLEREFRELVKATFSQ